jgi:hypothetical protein
MSGPLIAEGFSSVTRMLAGASHGAYRGPGVSADTIAQAVSATEGLDAGQLVTATRAAVGGADATTLQGGILGQVASTLGEVAMGEILRRVVDHARDWFDNRDRSGELLDDSRHAADTLEDIDAVAETACTEVVLALRAVIAQLCTFLNHLDPAVHTREFSECVGAGAALIEDAGQLILDCCQDRDAAVAVCLDEFLARGTALCEAPVCRTEVVDCPPAVPPVPEPAPEPVAPPKKQMEVPGTPQSVEPPAPEPAEPTPLPKKQMEVPGTPQSVEPPAPEPAEPPPPPKMMEPSTPEPVEPTPPPKKQMEVPTTPQSALVEEPVEPSVPELAPEDPFVPEEVCVESPTGEVHCGVLGEVGMGIALLGLALLIGALEDCLVEIETPVEPEPLPELEVPVEPAVVEPPPPPKQVENPPVPAASPAPETPPASPVPPAPAPEAPPTPPSPPAAVPGSARKAGAW